MTFANTTQAGYDIVVIAGSTGAKGYSPPNSVDPVLDASDSRVEQFSNGSVSVASEPLLHPNPYTDGRIGYGLAMGKALISNGWINTNRKVLLVPVAVENTGFSNTEWLKGGDAYNYALTQINAARALPGLNIVRAVVFSSAEYDLKVGQTAYFYAKLFDAFVASLRADLNTPFLPVVHAPLSNTSANAGRERSNFVAMINSLSFRYGAASNIDASGLTIHDSEYWTATSYRTIGQRLATSVTLGYAGAGGTQLPVSGISNLRTTRLSANRIRFEWNNTSSASHPVFYRDSGSIVWTYAGFSRSPIDIRVPKAGNYQFYVAGHTASATVADFARNAKNNLGMNVSRHDDFDTLVAFKNHWLRSRVDWFVWANNTTPPTFDELNYPKGLLPGQHAETPLFIGTMRNGQRVYPGPNLTITWEGSGTIAVRGDVGAQPIVTHSTPNTAFVEYPNNATELWLRITSSDPNNYVRNLRVTNNTPDSDDLSDPFNPEYLKLLERSTALRHMNGMKVNNSDQEHWSDRVLPRFSSQTGKGMAIEYCCELSNKINADAYFCIPHKANDDYIRRMARLVRDTLNKEQMVYVEWSNEVWNSMFSVHDYSKIQGAPLFPGATDFEACILYQAKRTCDVRRIWREEFAGQLNRLKIVLGTHVLNYGTSLIATGYNDPIDGNIKDLIDFIAVAPYFSGDLDRPNVLNAQQINAMSTAQLVTALNTAADQARADWNLFRTGNTAFKRSNGQTIPIIQYEGGQHLNPNSFPTQADKELVLAKFRPLNLTPEMGEVYRRYYKAWFNDNGADALACHYSDVYAPNIFGLWGVMEHMNGDGYTQAYPKKNAINDVQLARYNTQNGEPMTQLVATIITAGNGNFTAPGYNWVAPQGCNFGFVGPNPLGLTVNAATGLISNIPAGTYKVEVSGCLDVVNWQSGNELIDVLSGASVNGSTGIALLARFTTAQRGSIGYSGYEIVAIPQNGTIQPRTMLVSLPGGLTVRHNFLRFSLNRI